MDEKVSQYIEEQNSTQKEICRRLREIILKTFPSIKEEMKWGVPNYGNLYYYVALKTHVNLGFSIKNLIDDVSKAITNKLAKKTVTQIAPSPGSSIPVIS